ncbi:putative histamine H4 receptor-like [Apostichopus japonicus]|uniref:Putative histamine H4 receptor-like n=1 Tax=Stichopus japonicus TaxID=307972 RepID=A0A2G8JXR8_STIJA|nr:putative histamine H4 receptor-like [Apostichopus japonicus]
MEFQSGNFTNEFFVSVPVPLQVSYLVIGLAIILVNIIVMVAFVQDRAIRIVPANIFILNLAVSDLLSGLDLVGRFVWAVMGAEVPVTKSVACIFLGGLHYGTLVMSVMLVILISYDRWQMVAKPFAISSAHRRSRRPDIRHGLLYKATEEKFHGQLTAKKSAKYSKSNLSEPSRETDLSLSENVKSVNDPGLASAIVDQLKTANVIDESREIQSSGGISQLDKMAPRSRQSDRTKGFGNPSQERIYQSTKKEYRKMCRTARLLWLFVAVFVVGWLPLYLIIIIDMFNPLPDWTKLVASLNVSFNSFVNPFLYAYMSRKFRRRFVLMGKCKRR